MGMNPKEKTPFLVAPLEMLDQLGEAKFALASTVWACLLRDRDDVYCCQPL